jgi:hypothetical protein
MQNLTVHPGGPSPFLLRSAHARPHPALSRAADNPDPPVSGTAARHCAGPPVRRLSPLSVSTGNARAAHVTRERTSPTSAALRPLPGTVRRLGSGPTAPPRPRSTPRPDPPPPLSPFFPPLPRCRRAIPSPLAAPLVLQSPILSDSPSRVPNSPHRFPRPDCRLRPPEASPSRGFRPSTAAVRHSPVSSSPSYQSLQFLTISSPPCLSGAIGPHTRRRHPPEPPPHRRTPPPDAVCAASPSTRRSGAPLPSPPCLTPSP